ncbi:MAG: FliH/SctL family protein [Planctomycetales bacterium]|nr:FliH/SctL family protein [Planctomycetales bacterium]
MKCRKWLWNLLLRRHHGWSATRLIATCNQSVKVLLNPADHNLLQALLSDPVSRQQLELVSCKKDESIPRGSVRVESGRRILLTDMHTRLEEIRRTWMEKLDDTQIERRGDGSASRTLRRFPERRETA